jgi:hypothetical protein
MSFKTDAKLSRGELRAVITKADGRVIDRGVIAYHSSNPIKHRLGNAMVKLRYLIFNRRKKP